MQEFPLNNPQTSAGLAVFSRSKDELHVSQLTVFDEFANQTMPPEDVITNNNVTHEMNKIPLGLVSKGVLGIFPDNDTMASEKNRVLWNPIFITAEGGLDKAEWEAKVARWTWSTLFLVYVLEKVTGAAMCQSAVDVWARIIYAGVNLEQITTLTLCQQKMCGFFHLQYRTLQLSADIIFLTYGARKPWLIFYGDFCRSRNFTGMS